MEPSPYTTLFEKTGSGSAEVTVCVPLYNYEDYILQALDSVVRQDLEAIDLIVIDDASTDRSAQVVERWLSQHGARFDGARLIQHVSNQWLAASRNTAISLASTPWVFTLDADNTLYPRCLGRCLEAIRATGAEAAYPIIEVFGERVGLVSCEVWSRERLARGNYIDAMALLQASAVHEVGGYTRVGAGWEDYDLWCKFVERGFHAVQVPEILARYREHSSSMLRSETNLDENIRRLHRVMKQRHPWLQLEI